MADKDGDTGARLRAAGIRPYTLGDLLNDLGDALNRVQELGLRWRSTRFHRYSDAIKRARSEIAAGRLEWSEKHDERALLLEALGQGSQLVRSLTLWKNMPAPALRARLDHVLSGPDLPVVAQDANDHSRNILLELATAAFLSPDGSRVSLGSDPEDALFCVTKDEVLPIECKRPAAPGTLNKNVKRVRSQLDRHLHRFPLGGIAVFGIDRVIDAVAGSAEARSLNAAGSAAEAVSTAKRMAEEWAIAAAHVGGARLARVAPIVMAALFGAVLCLDPVAPVIVAQMAWVPLRDGSKARDELLARARVALRS